MSDQLIIPPFMKEYYEGSNLEGKVQLKILARNYEMQRQDFMQNKYPAKAIFQDDWNKLTGQNVKLDPDKLVWHIQEEYRAQAEKIALHHGYAPKSMSQPEKRSTPKAKQAGKPARADIPKKAQPQQAATTAAQKEQSAQRTAESPVERTPRDAFIKELQAQRQRQARRRLTQQQTRGVVQPAATGAGQSEKERFLAQLQAMRAQGQRLTQKP